MPKKQHGGGEEEGGGPGMERWLLTYSDMITLLLALFVILFALSTINANKFKAFALGLTKSFSNQVTKQNPGLLPKQSSLSPKPPTHPSVGTPPTATTPSLTQIAAQINQALSSAGLSTYATAQVAAQGVVVQMLADKAYFAVDSATLGPVGDRVVDTIAGVIGPLPNYVEVQGYTDNQPIYGGPFTSNWELSAVRAVNVVQRLTTADKITPNRLSAVGYATTHPNVPNTSPANQAQNRRIDVIVLTTKVQSVGPVGGSSS